MLGSECEFRNLRQHKLDTALDLALSPSKNVHREGVKRVIFMDSIVRSNFVNRLGTWDSENFVVSSAHKESAWKCNI